MKNSLDIIKLIQEKVKDYLIKCNIKSLVIGVSGGFDSGFGCAILAPVCKELGIPLIGRYIHIESNGNEEKSRAIAIGNAFCTDFKCKDLTMEFHNFLHKAEEESIFGEFRHITPKEQKDKIRRGNIKVRMRIMYLYNMAHHFNGIIVGCNNATENELGFFTLGDSGDIQPFISFYKTDLYNMAKEFLSTLTTDNEKNALQSVIDAIPTDGLGITSSDVEQFGAKSYTDVDDILKNYICYNNTESWDNVYYMLCNQYTEETVNKIITRKINSEFKRNHPHKIII